MAEKISARLQTPVDAEGKRKDIHLLNTTDEVIVNPDSENSETLTEYLGDLNKKMDSLSDEIIDRAIGSISGVTEQLRADLSDSLKRAFNESIVINKVQPHPTHSVFWIKPID